MPENQEKKYIISESIREGILAYLRSKPYHEVADGVAVLSQLPPLPHEPIKEDDNQGE